jgi:hypothetical protein
LLKEKVRPKEKCSLRGALLMVSQKQKFYSIFFKSRLSLHPVFKSNFRRMERSDILRGNGHKTCFEKNPKHCPSPTAQRRVVEAKKFRRGETEVLLNFFQKIVGFQRAKPLVAHRSERNQLV